jgi:hypothetical protein
MHDNTQAPARRRPSWWRAEPLSKLARERALHEWGWRPAEIEATRVATIQALSRLIAARRRKVTRADASEWA